MKTYDRILVVDLEATCWKGGRSPEGEPSEVIQVGSCCLILETLEVIAPVTTFCAPVRSRVSEYCTALTGIAPEMLDEAPAFAAVMQHLRDRGRNRKVPWASWGQGDRERLWRGCQAAEVKFPLSSKHTDIKHLAGLMSFGITRDSQSLDLNLADTLARLGLSSEGRPHDAGVDAVNAARILALLFYKSRRGF